MSISNQTPILHTQKKNHPRTLLTITLPFLGPFSWPHPPAYTETPSPSSPPPTKGFPSMDVLGTRFCAVAHCRPETSVRPEGGFASQGPIFVLMGCCPPYGDRTTKICPSPVPRKLPRRAPIGSRGFHGLKSPGAPAGRSAGWAALAPQLLPGVKANLRAHFGEKSIPQFGRKD